MRRYLATTAALTTLLFACGKKEETPPPQPAAATTEAPKPVMNEPTKDNNGAAGTADDKVKKDGDPSAPGGGTDPSRSAAPSPTDVKPATPMPALVASAVPGERAPLTPSSIETFPADVVAVGGTPSLATLVKSFVTAAAAVPGAQLPPDPLGMAMAALHEKLHIDLSWVDTDKPLRFGVPDPKKYPNGFVVLLAVKDGATVDAKSMEGAKEGGGHFLTLTIGDKQVFLDKVDGGILATSHDGLAKSLEGFVKDLAAWVPKDPLVLDTSVENITHIFADEIANAKKTVADMSQALAQNPEMATKMGHMMEMAAGGFALVEGTSRMSLSLDPTTDFPRIALAFKGLPGSPLEKVAKEMEGRKVTMAGAVPADAWFVIGYNTPSQTGYFSDAQSLVDAITKERQMGPVTITWTDDERKALMDLVKRAQELGGDQAVAWLREEAGHPFVFEVLSEVKDGAATRSAIVAIGDFLYKKLWSEGRKAALAQGAKEEQVPQEMSFKDLLGMASAQSAQIGIGLAVNESSTKAGSNVGALAVKVDWSRLPLRGAMAKLGDILGTDIGIGIGGEGTHLSLALGPDAAGRVARLLDGAANIAEATDPWLSMAKDQAFFALLRPARLLRALVEVVPDLAEARDVIASLPDDPAVVRAHSDGSVLSIDGVFPAKVLITLGAMTMR